MAESEPVHGTDAFGLEELFFSTTDERGFIRSSNDVFVRVSRYQRDELLGQPHNIVRNPAMPRIVFRELWDHLQAGEGIGAYVLNRAKDGSPYWVFAVARPVVGGHLSVRLKPTTPLFPVVVSLYEELRSVEAGVEQGGRHHAEAMEASAAVLADRLAEVGFDSYDTFMRVATVAEVTARRTALGATGLHGDGRHSLAAFLDGELGSIEAYLALNRQLTERSANLVTLTGEASLLGFNVKVAASRVGGDGAPLQALAGIMQEVGLELVECSRALRLRLDSTRSALERVGFSIAVASLQNDMAAIFAAESTDDHPEARESGALMADCLRTDLDTVVDALQGIDANLTVAGDLVADLTRSLQTLYAVIGSSRVEATRTTGAGFFVALFERAESIVGSGLDDARSISAAVAGFTRNRPTPDRAGMLRELEAPAMA
ncbi:MAG: PAS domain-containing protein [Acidimicrobiales bacterium]